jgi:hypothetical protein
MKAELTKFRTKLQALLQKARDVKRSPKARAPEWNTDTDVEMSRTVLIASAGSLERQMTKFVLIMKARPDKASTEGICRHVLEPCQKLVDALDLAVHCGTAKTMQDEFTKSVVMILSAVDTMTGTVLKGGAEGEWNEKTGRVWEFCQGTSSLAKSNKISVKRKMMKVVKLIKDTSREFQEMGDDAEIVESREGDEEVASGEKEDPSTFEFDQDEFDDFLMGGDTMTTAEHKCLLGCIKVLNMTEFLLKRSVKELALLDQAQESAPVSAITEGVAAATIGEGVAAKGSVVAKECAGAGASAATGATIFAAAAEGTSSFDKTAWAEALVVEFGIIEDLAVDLGAALYPPHSNNTIVEELAKCDVAAGRLFDLLVSSPWIQGDEHQKQRTELQTGKTKMHEATEKAKPASS